MSKAPAQPRLLSTDSHRPPRPRGAARPKPLAVKDKAICNVLTVAVLDDDLDASSRVEMVEALALHATADPEISDTLVEVLSKWQDDDASLMLRAKAAAGLAAAAARDKKLRKALGKPLSALFTDVHHMITELEEVLAEVRAAFAKADLTIELSKRRRNEEGSDDEGRSVVSAPKFVDLSIMGLEDDELEVDDRVELARELAEAASTDDELRYSLKSMIEDSDIATKVREALIEELAPEAADDDSFRDTLMGFLSDSDGDPIVRSAAAKGLAPLAVEDREVRRVLLALVDDEQSTVFERGQIAVGLATVAHRDPNILTHVLEAFLDEAASIDLREEIALALARASKNGGRG